nr:tripartite tricarboxylate transporter TctB family protein [uncultured Fretibacterium sp.]
MKLKRTTSKDDFLCGVIFLCVGLVYASQINKIQVSELSPISARFLPIIIVYGMLLLSVIELTKSFGLLGKIAIDKITVKVKKNYLCVILSLVLSLCYVLSLLSLGFVISSALYMFLQMWFFAPRNDKRTFLLLAISIAVSFAIYFIFRVMLNLMLPNGILTGYF